METFDLERPVLAVDVIVFAIQHGQLHVLLSRRQDDPFPDAPALPGVAVRVDETLEEAAKRALRQKSGWAESVDALTHLEQLATFDGLYRDPRGRTVSVGYLGMVRNLPEVETTILWKPVKEIAPNSLPFDHCHIIETAITRLQGKLRYTNVAKNFLPDVFRIDELQIVYEAILGRRLNRTNFRVKLLKIGLIEHVGIHPDAVNKQGGRPPHLYRFPQSALEIVDREFL
ncbi:NUDIX hydrolase [Candidatus Moduliflexus flocculans]|uniref:NUDIX hydrolase n=1 Tax=Candidatus Moduliflexus flocculans TaxID=1499966 RepID=A0A081BQI5_9BACT|nr:NUDIX hydrolase [Candidatus Moduliflexus flocculans]